MFSGHQHRVPTNRHLIIKFALLFAALLAAVLFFGTTSAEASPAYPVERTFDQPDGAQITLRLWGDEFAHGWETLDGHAVVMNETSGYWEYAVRDSSGALTGSGVVVGNGAPPAAPGLRPTVAAINSARAEAGAPPLGQARLASAPAWAGSDTDMIFLIVEFADLACPTGFEDTDFQTDLFGSGATGPGDLDDYFREISYGAFEVDGVVEGGASGCYTAANNRSFYNDNNNDAKKLVAEVVGLADGDVDFSQYDNDGDGDVDVIGVIYAGGGVFDGCGTSSGVDDLWPHSSGLGGSAVTVDGVTVDRYIIQSAVTSTNGTSSCDQRMTIGLFAHEMGHSLGIPDLYDTDGSSEGVGWWSAMASQFRSTVNLADTPPHYDPWSKWFLGWITPDDKTGFTGNGPIPQTEETGYVIQLLANPGGAEKGGSGEYFLIENRQQVGFDAQLPGCGLLIWHIEESQTTNKFEGHTTATHRLVDLEEADGLDELDSTGDRGDTGDPYPGSTNNRLFSDTSTPHANLYDGTATGVRIADISGCAPVMSANFGYPAADVSITKFDSPDPVVAGEQLSYSITVHNAGPGTATDVTVTDVLPAGVTYVTDTDSCVEAPAGTLTCSLPDMLSGDTESFTILVDVDADVVANAGGPTALLNTATVDALQPDDDLTNNEATAATIVIEEADLFMYKECKPDVTVLATQQYDCTLIIENLGPSYARDVSVRDEIVSSLASSEFSVGSFVLDPSRSDSGPSYPPAPGNGVTLEFDLLEDLEPKDGDAGGRWLIEYVITADEPQDINNCAQAFVQAGGTPDPDTGNNVSCDGVTFVAVSDLAITKSDAPDPVIAGQQLTYSLTVTNNGPSDATNVVIKDLIPAGVTVDWISSSGGTCNAGTPGDAAAPASCTFDTVGSGLAESMTIQVTVLPQTLGSLTNDAWVYSDNWDPDNSDDLATTTTAVDTSADLSVVKVDAPDPVVAGEGLTYQVTISNAGPSTALGVELTDMVPAGAVFAGATISDGVGACELLPPDVVECTGLSDLDPGDSVSVFIDTVVDASVPDGAVLSNEATVSAATSDPNFGNNTATADTDVIAVADLELVKVSSLDTSNPSPEIVYTITVNNLGSSDAQDVSILDELPSVTKGKKGKEKVIFVFATEGCTYDPDAAPSHTVTCDAGTLAAGASVVFEIRIQVEGSRGLLTNVATVSSSTTDPDLSNNQDVDDIAIKGGKGKPGGPH